MRRSSTTSSTPSSAALTPAAAPGTNASDRRCCHVPHDSFFTSVLYSGRKRDMGWQIISTRVGRQPCLIHRHSNYLVALLQVPMLTRVLIICFRCWGERREGRRKADGVAERWSERAN